MSDLAIEALLDDKHPLKVETAEWARAELSKGDRVSTDRDSVFAADDWKRCAARGLQGLLVAEEFGGQGRDIISALLILEGLGLGCRDNGLTFAIGSQIVSTQHAIEEFGTAEQKQRWLPGLCDGSLYGSFAITEPDSGSDPFGLSARAERTGDGSYRLSGRKSYITLGSVSDVVVIFASTDPDAGRWGLSAFVVATDTPGVELQPNREKMGLRTTPFGDIVFDGALVEDAERLGPEGAGAAIFGATLDAERAFVFATHIGAMERQLDETVAYARTRTQSGRPIGGYQAVSHRIAEMQLRHETSRLLLYKAGLLVADGRPSTMAAALVKLAASEAAVASALDATLVHGAKGYVSEFEVERELRDAVGGLVYSGTSDIQRNIIAGLLGLG